MHMYFKETHNNKGFTLIELMVAVSVFLILVSLSTAIFIQTLRTQRTIINITSNNESASEALEQISRDIRTGYSFSTPDISDGVAKTLIFTSSQETNTVGYKLVNNSVSRCIGTCQSDSDYKAITPPNIDITSMSFIPANLSSGVPRVTILISVITPSNVKPQINTYLETTVSSRNF